MKIYFATWLFDQTLGKSLTKLEASDRLLSYFFLQQQEITNQQLTRYIKTGKLKTTKE
jgi:hypothetical protein